MAIREIRKDGDDILRKKSREVDTIDDRIREFLDDMLETIIMKVILQHISEQTNMQFRISNTYCKVG